MREYDFSDPERSAQIAQDSLTERLTERPNQTDSILNSNPEEIWPDALMSAVVAAQRQVIIGVRPAKNFNKKLASAKMEPYWEEVYNLRNASSTKVEFAINQLVLDDLSILPERAANAIDKINKFNVSVVSDLADAKRGRRAALKYALAGFVDKKYGVQFNPNSSHLMAAAIAGLLENNGSLRRLDVSDPNPLLAVRLDQLSGYLKATLKSSEQGALPPQIWRIKEGLTEFFGDVQALRNGNRAVGRQPGRKWKLIFNENGEQMYNSYLRSREALRDSSNVSLARMIRFSPKDLDAKFSAIMADLEDEGDTPQENLALNEELGVAWAAASLKKENPLFNGLLVKYSDAKQNLETYVQAGYPLIAAQVDPFWLRYVTWQSWLDRGGETTSTVFTNEYHSVSQDVREAGRVFSRMLQNRMGHAGANDFGGAMPSTESNGYDELSFATGVMVGFDLTHVAERSMLGPVAAFGVLEDLEEFINALSKKQYASLLAGLPNHLKVETQKIRR